MIEERIADKTLKVQLHFSSSTTRIYFCISEFRRNLYIFQLQFFPESF